MENPQPGWGFRKAFSFEPVIKTPFDLLKHLAVWQLQKFNKKSKGGPDGGRKELSAHPMERRKRGKSDTIDTECAAHAAFSGIRTVTPKTRDGMIESLRVLNESMKICGATTR